jgi:uncharacterized protein YbgA (DUF1722 family)/uncharacterized protein YbbK (DUF523 family)
MSSLLEDESASRGAWQSWHTPDMPIQLGVSSCLLGESVRFDGGHARDRFVDETLGQWVSWTRVCPEIELGMGTPRPSVRLVRGETGDRLIAPKTGADFTDEMKAFTTKRVEPLADLDGYVFKRSSPSCGLERISVYRENGHSLHRNAMGVYAQGLTERWPLLPVEEDGRLNDARLRENFIERIFCRNRWRVLQSKGLSRESLVAFHTAHKLLLRAHDETGYQRMGRLVASFGTRPDAEVIHEYEAGFQHTLKVKTNAKLHTNVLHHSLGYLKKLLEPREKAEILAAIEDYRQGLLPLVVPLTLLRLFVVKYEIEYLDGQLYFDPHPKELMLRNHV